MASGINPITSATTAAPTPSTTSSSDGIPTEGMFLRLLVSQLQNQDPLNPTDSTQFVSQLAQISELEQVMGIRSDIETEMAAGTTTTPTTTTTTAGNSGPAASSSNNPGTTPVNNPISL